VRALRIAPVVAATLVAGCGGGTTAPPAMALAGFVPTTVTYCTDGGKDETLDIYEPARGSSPHPLLIVIHGGSWTFGSSTMIEQNPLTQRVVSDLLTRGFAVASINYRLAPAYPWPAQIIDTRCAVRYLRAAAARWHVDPRRFVALGNSAGAHLASLVALSDGRVPGWNNSQFADQSSALSAVVDCWGPVDLAAAGWSAAALAIGRQVFGVTWGADSETLRLDSPVTYVHPGSPPFVIVQGVSDTLVPLQQSVELLTRLHSAGGAATLLEVAHAGHELRPSGGSINPDVETLVQRVVSFVMSVAG
jgi:acetyl esterase/lipase